MTNPLFGNNDDTQDHEDVDAATATALLVGEGKKYKTADEAIKALYHSQKFIPRLEQELREERAKLQERKNGEDLLALLEAKLKAPSNEPSPKVNENKDPSNTGNPMTQDDITNLLKNTLAQDRAQEQATNNLNRVIETLKSAWGPGFQQDLRAKAQAMHVSEEYLSDLAKKSPDVFLSAVGLTAKKGNGTASLDVLPTRSSQGSSFGSSSNEVRNNDYYNKLMKDNKRAYWSQEVQSQLHKDALAMGEKFFTKP